MSESETRLQVVFADVRRAIDDIILKHQVSMEELLAVAQWVQEAAYAGELPLVTILFAKAVLKGTEGATYAHPETDGASYWEMEGPAYLPGAPRLDSPAVLPMRPDEPGEPLIVSGTVRSTTGEPLPGAVIDIWQIDADNTYSGVKAEDFGMLGIMPDVANDATGIPTYNLRAKIVADGDGALRVPHDHARHRILRVQARRPAHGPRPGAAATGRAAPAHSLHRLGRRIPAADHPDLLRRRPPRQWRYRRPRSRRRGQGHHPA